MRLALAVTATLAPLSAFFFTWLPASAATVVSNLEDSGDTTWTQEGSPYIVDNQYFSAVNPGATLTIEAGVIVKFTQYSTLNIYGNLVIKGTLENPVHFTSILDDSIGGDTNEDSNNTSPSNSSGWRINLHQPRNLSITNINFHYSSGGIWSYINSGNPTASISINNLDFHDSSGALYIEKVNGSINNLKMDAGDIHIYDSELSINNITNHGRVFTYRNSLNISNLTKSTGGLYIYDTNLSLISTTIANTTESFALFIDNSNVHVRNLNLLSGSYGAIQIDEDSYLYADKVNISNFPSASAIYNYGNFIGKNLDISDNYSALAGSGTFKITRSKIQNSTVPGIQGGTGTISQSLIQGNNIYGISGGNIDARYNYWGHPDGPTLGHVSDPTVIIRGDSIPSAESMLYEPWLRSYCETDCNSNIMFLPGIMGSRLYEDAERLWEGNDNQISKLYMNEVGESVREGIVTKDVIETFDGPLILDRNIYKSFLDDLEELKADNTINDYKAVPYDWRLSLPDILSSGIEDENGNISYIQTTSEPYIEKTLRDLAASSQNGKVTIVTHSNGGLLTKALINSIGNEAGDLIDQIILVAVPQLGTPQAIGTLLHGYDSGIPKSYPFILSQERARDISRNMPTAYQLLPFDDYYNSVGATINTPYITFEEGFSTQGFIDLYGHDLDSEELIDFIKGAEGRHTPSYNDLKNPAKGNSFLLTEAKNTQSEIDSSWQVPDGINVHQIAGIGEDTLININYKTLPECIHATVFGVCLSKRNSLLSYDVTEAIDGDGTVVTPSALAISSNADNVERWWFNLDIYNGILPSVLRKKHSDIMEINEVREFILENLITRRSTSLPNHISSTKPTIKEQDKLIFTLHSPLALSAANNQGGVVSQNEITIPGASYTRYGEIQVLKVPTGTDIKLILTGESSGSFTLEAKEVEEGEVINSTTFSAIPSSTSTIAHINITGSLESMSSLIMDYDGDTNTDLTYTAILNEIITEPDPILATQKPTTQVIGSYRKITNVNQEASKENILLLITQLQIISQRLEELRPIISNEKYQSVRQILNTLLTKILMNLTQ